VELASARVYRALAYAAALNRAGYTPTPRELEAYAADPDQGIAAQIFDRIYAYELYQGRHEKQETFGEYLLRVGWTVEVNGRVAITDCGRHALLALEDAEYASEGLIEVVLDPKDPVVLSRAVKRLAELGKALLVDPYFGLDQFLPVMQHTEIDRILISDASKKAEREELAHALSTIQAPRMIEVRMTEKRKTHDRYVIPPHGPITFIGGSLNTIGRSPTVMGQLHDAAGEIREHYESIWTDADVVGVARSPAPGDPQKAY
jgi:hypothetical protein